MEHRKPRIDVTISRDAIRFIDWLIGEHGDLSQFIDEQVKAHPRYEEWKNVSKRPKQKGYIMQEEVSRIESLTSDEKEREITQIVSESHLGGEQAEALRAHLRLYYKRPERYARVPDARDVLHANPRPLPYEGESR